MIFNITHYISTKKKCIYTYKFSSFKINGFKCQFFLVNEAVKEVNCLEKGLANAPNHIAIRFLLILVNCSVFLRQPVIFVTSGEFPWALHIIGSLITSSFLN